MKESMMMMMWMKWTNKKVVIMHWEQREQRYKKNYVSSWKKGSLFGCLCVGDGELCKWQQFQ